MMKRLLTFSLLLVFNIAAFAQSSMQPGRWPEKRANDWYQKQAWLIGCNYIPANAINELEMWQAETFDPKTIDKELGWAASIGMNTLRVFLHDLLWQQDAEGFKKRVDQFLSIAEKHKIKPMFVLFDSCWDPFPQPGKQRDPKPGVHNSGWMQSPGAKALQDPSQYPRLEAYVKGVVEAFANDPRILAWDVWNEPDNPNTSSYGKLEPKNKVELVLALLPQAFAWARSANPQQPLTCGVWKGDWSSEEKMTSMDRLQIGLSDIISFHNYDDAAEFEKRVMWLQRYNRPLLCTEYMARGNKSTFQGTLPIAKKHRVAAYNWGFVAGKTQTNLPWDSWRQPYIGREPSVWFHEIFRPDGTPYRAEDVELIRGLTGGQTQPQSTTYALFEFMKMEPGKAADYRKMEREIWMPIHHERVRMGLIKSWSLWGMRFPGGTAREYDTIAITTFDKFSDVENSYPPEVFKKVHPKMTDEERGSRTNAMRSMVRTELTTLLDVTRPASSGEPPRYAFIGYMKPEYGKVRQYVELERRYWKPIHQERVSRGMLRSWSLYLVRFPGGTDRQYTHFTIQLLDRFQDLETQYPEGIWEKVHPETKQDEIDGRTNAARKMVRTDVWTLLEHVQ